MHITRRAAIALSAMALCLAGDRAIAQEPVVVRLRADREVVQSIPPRLRQGLITTTDTSPEAQELLRLAPPGKALPVLLIVMGALSVPVIWNSIQEMLREYYYGGVLIDTRERPPSFINSKQIPADMVFVVDPSGNISQFRSAQFTEKALAEILKKVK